MERPLLWIGMTVIRHIAACKRSMSNTLPPVALLVLLETLRIALVALPLLPLLDPLVTLPLVTLLEPRVALACAAVGPLIVGEAMGNATAPSVRWIDH